MAVISGKDGSVVLTNAATTIKSWTLSYVGDALETTNFDTTGSLRSFIPGLTGWTGSFEGFFSGSNSAVPGSTGTITLKTGTGSTGLWHGSIVLTGMDVSDPRDGVITQSYTFQGNGALATTT